MKRFGYLFEKIVDIENIKLAHKNARRGKSIKLRSKTSGVRALHSYVGWLRHCNGWNLTNKLRSIHGSSK